MVAINSQLAGMPFVWHFICAAADKSMASDHVTVPLMAMVAELARRQQELVTIITAKDKEIDDYKSQGVRTSRKHIETLIFDETAFKNNMVMSKNFESTVKKLGSAAFNAEGQELYRQIMTKNAWIHHSPSKGDVSDSLDDDESLNAGVGPSLPSWTNRVPASLAKGSSPIKSSPDKSPLKSPAKSPDSVGSPTPTKDTEMLRRQALERRLEQEDAKKQDKVKKKKKKLAF